jgi:hypothetical protein
LCTDESKKKISPDDEGPIKEVDIAKVKKTAAPLPGGFEWCTIDLTSEAEASIYTFIFMANDIRSRKFMSSWQITTSKILKPSSDSTIRKPFSTGNYSAQT